jgi:hypothetical protein
LDEVEVLEVAKIIDEVWKPADFTVGSDSSFGKIKIDAKSGGIGKLDVTPRSWTAQDLSSKSGKSWSADDLSTGFGQVKQTPEQFINNYIARQHKDMNRFVSRSPEAEYHDLAADRLAVQNGDHDMFSGYHRSMAKRFRQSSQDTFLQKVADNLGIDVFRLERAFNQARIESGGAGDVEMDVTPNWRDEKNKNKAPEFKRTLPKNAFGVIDINIIFIRDWLEEKGTSVFGNKFAFMYIILAVTVVGGLVVLMLSGVLGDIIKTGIPKYIEF